MTTTNGGVAPQTSQQPIAALNLLRQYVKDFSFENPNAPTSLHGEGQSNMRIGIT